MFPVNHRFSFNLEQMEILQNAAYENTHFEDWVDACKEILWPPLHAGLLSDPDLHHIAYIAGIRLAHDPLTQARIASIGFHYQHADDDWFQSALVHLEYKDYAMAAHLLVSHGFRTAFCCGGLDPDCKLQPAIRIAFCSLN